MTTAASGDHVRPPSERYVASAPGAAVRPTARQRPLLPTRLVEVDNGFRPDDPYVRRFWVAALGQGAVGELLRVVRAGADGAWIPLPIWLPQLLRADLVWVVEGTLVTRNRIPPVPVALQRRFPPSLRDEHRRRYRERRRPSGARGPTASDQEPDR
ncbi:MAG TPA: hypothetical protein VK070_03505 [Acidimicrobiia bacterium]|nr:hypothetical protein [Acidimicrobiia bacterium]